MPLCGRALASTFRFSTVNQLEIQQCSMAPQAFNLCSVTAASLVLVALFASCATSKTSRADAKKSLVPVVDSSAVSTDYCVVRKITARCKRKACGENPRSHCSTLLRQEAWELGAEGVVLQGEEIRSSGHAGAEIDSVRCWGEAVSKCSVL